MLAVEHSPRHTIPELIQRLEYDGEVSSSVASEKSMHVFEDNNFRATRRNQGCNVMEEAGLVAAEAGARSHSSKGEILAGEACGPDVGIWDNFGIDNRYILLNRNIGELFRKHSPAESLLLAEKYGRNSRPLEAEVESADT